MRDESYNLYLSILLTLMVGLFGYFCFRFWRGDHELHKLMKS
jgi:hypothetical protein